jgi:hypothetical protein
MPGSVGLVGVIPGANASRSACGILSSCTWKDCDEVWRCRRRLGGGIARDCGAMIPEDDVSRPECGRAGLRGLALCEGRYPPEGGRVYV